MSSSERTPQLIFLGAPGAGKGTQAKKLAEKCGLEHVSTGDLLRKEVGEATGLGLKVKHILESGELVEDSLVLEVLKANCDFAHKSYIFDGYPRNVAQGKSMTDGPLKGMDYKAIYFDLPQEMIVERLVNRRTCPNCKRIYNILYAPPRNGEECDDCKGVKPVQRKDDEEQVIRNRLQVYDAQTGPLLDYYRAKGILVTVDASQGPDKVFEELLTLVRAS